MAIHLTLNTRIPLERLGQKQWSQRQSSLMAIHPTLKTRIDFAVSSCLSFI